MTIRHDPHAIIEITRPGMMDGQARVVYDSWKAKGLFESIDVELVTNESSMATIRLFDPEFRVIDSFAPTAPTQQSVIRVWLGFGDNLGEPVFKGLLAQIERGDRSTTFIAFDMGYKMKLEKKAGYKNKKDDLAILRELATRNGLQFEGPENPLKLEPHSTATQDEQTDWEWFSERAGDAGLKFYVRQDTMFAKYPAKVGTPVMTLKNRTDFTITPEFEFIFRTPENQDGKPKLVIHRRRGVAGKRVEGQSNLSPGTRTDVVLKRDAAKPNKSKLTKRAQAQKDLECEHAFEGSVDMIMQPSQPRLDYRKTVSIANVSKLMSGDYVCDAIGYSFAPGRLAVSLDLYRDIKE